MSGLKAQIRRRVQTLNPLNQMQMMRTAKDVEEELREDDDDAGKYGSKKGGRDRLGRVSLSEQERVKPKRDTSFQLGQPDSKNRIQWI